MRGLRRFGLVLLLNLFLVAGLSASPCQYLRGMYFSRLDVFDPQRPLSLYVTSSNVGFKRQTKFLFDDVAVLGQNFTKALHTFFDAHLREAAASSGIELKKTQSTYIKFNEYTVQATPDMIDGLGSIVFEAQRNALNDMAEMLFDGTQRHVQTLQGTLSLLEIQAIQNAVQRKIAGPEALIDYVKNDYGVGIDKALVGSHFMTKYTAMTPFDEANQVFFSSELFRNHVQLLLTKRADLSWAFDFANGSQVELFALIRRHQEASHPSEWTPAFKSLLARKYPGKQPNPAELQLAYGELMDYIQQLNVFDFLPRDAMKNGTYSSGDFRKFQNPTGFVYIDLRKLGANNMLLMHELVPQLQQQLTRVDQIRNRLDLIEEPTQNDIRELRLALADLQKSREEVLRQSSELVNQTFGTALQVMDGLGIDKEARVYWRAGDDLIVAYRSSNHSAKDVVRYIKNHPFLKRQIRIGAEDLRGQSKPIALESVRLRAGAAAAPLKILESLDMPNEFALMMRTPANGQPEFAFYEMDVAGDMIEIDPLLHQLVLRRLDRSPTAKIQAVP